MTVWPFDLILNDKGKGHVIPHSHTIVLLGRTVVSKGRTGVLKAIVVRFSQPDEEIRFQLYM